MAVIKTQVELLTPLVTPDLPEPDPEAKGIPNDMLVRMRLKMRAARSELKRKFEEQDAKIKQAETMVDNEILRRLLESKTTGFSTPDGTVYTREEFQCSIADHAVFDDFIRTTGDLDFLQARVSPSHVREYIEMHKTVPPGLNIFRTVVPAIRKKSS